MCRPQKKRRESLGEASRAQKELRVPKRRATHPRMHENRSSLWENKLEKKKKRQSKWQDTHMIYIYTYTQNKTKE